MMATQQTATGDDLVWLRMSGVFFRSAVLDFKTFRRLKADLKKTPEPLASGGVPDRRVVFFAIPNSNPARAGEWRLLSKSVFRR
jgi:hypothetical protein